MHPACLSPPPPIVSSRALLEASIEHRATWVLRTTTNQGRPPHKVSPRERTLGGKRPPQAWPAQLGAAAAKLGCHPQPDRPPWMRALVNCPTVDQSLGLSGPQSPDICAVGLMPAPSAHRAQRGVRHVARLRNRRRPPAASTSVFLGPLGGLAHHGCTQ